MRISLCTSCKNRFHHLKQTLLPNIEIISSFGTTLELIIVNYNSQDQMHEEMKNYIEFIERGYVTYYRTTEFRYFSQSHAKNLSHILAAGDYVANLDADKIISKAFVTSILNIIANSPYALFKGEAGLMGLRKSDFLALGGYDEDLTGWGYEDTDLLNRAEEAGFQCRVLAEPSLVSSIEHSDSERLMNFDPSLFERFETKDPDVIKTEMNKRNRMYCLKKLEKGMIRANENRIFGSATVTKNFSDQLLKTGWITTNSRPRSG